MNQISNVVGVVAGLLRGEGGLQSNIDAIAAADSGPGIKLGAGDVVAQNLPVDIAERNTNVSYPSVYVYCQKAVNHLREKFRTFSGQVNIAIEVRVSADRVEALDAQMNVLVDAVTSTLDQNRGEVGAGIFFGGEYEIGFSAIKHGGRNFIQMGTVTFALEVSRN